MDLGVELVERFSRHQRRKSDRLPIEYWPSAIAQLQMEIPRPAIRAGVHAVTDASFVVNEAKDFTTWGGVGFLIWYTGYFSLCGWMVLFLMSGSRRFKISL